MHHGTSFLCGHAKPRAHIFRGGAIYVDIYLSLLLGFWLFCCVVSRFCACDVFVFCCFIVVFLFRFVLVFFFFFFYFMHLFLLLFGGVFFGGVFWVYI